MSAGLAILNDLTDFGDAAVTLPLLLTIGAVLAFRGGPFRFGWIVAIGGAYAVILALKLAFGAFPSIGAPFEVRSPSGHTATAAAAYGGLALLLSSRWTVGLAVASLVAALVGSSRVALDDHTVGEVLVGAAVGIGGVLMLAVVSRRAPALSRQSTVVLLVLSVVVIVAGYGRHAAIEPRLQHIEQRLSF